MDKNKLFAIVMAGGRGERFWPQSRASHPKQLLRLIGNLTLIEQTVERLKPLVPLENIIIITNHDYIAPMRSLLSRVPPGNIIGEPVGRDTAPCVALAAALVKSRGGDDAIMMMMPADHVIRDTGALVRVLEDSAVVAAGSDSILTIGVTPNYPSTGYGYIQCGDEIPGDRTTRFYKSEGFKEKPDLKTAENFVKAGCYKWNSGMFVWRLATIMQALEAHSPELYGMAQRLAVAGRSGSLDAELMVEYEKCPKISIDYAVMEKVDNVIVAECSFDWDDVGSWTALRNQIRASESNNVVRGLFTGLDAKNCIVVGEPQHLIAAVDVEDLIIVQTEDATLICNAKSAQRIKELVNKISENPEMRRFL